MERDDPIEAPRVRRGDRAPGEPRNVAWLYLLPGLAFYLLFTLGPLLHTAWLSLFDWDGLTAGRYIGLANYREALGDPLVHDAFRHSAELVVFYALLPIAIGLLLTAMLTRRPVRGFAGFRAVLFLPQIIAGVVVAQAWVWIYAEQGPQNEFLRTTGLGSLARPWLGSFTWALPAIGVIGTWVTYGLCMVLFVAGVQKIPSSLYDAARVDGAGPFAEFFAVTLPGLRNEIVVALLLTVVAALRVFDVIFVTTKGGPGTETYVPTLLIYKRAFVSGEVGSAAAIATILTALVLLVSVGIRRLEEAPDA